MKKEYIIEANGKKFKQESDQLQKVEDLCVERMKLAFAKEVKITCPNGAYTVIKKQEGYHHHRHPGFFFQHDRSNVVD